MSKIKVECFTLIKAEIFFDVIHGGKYLKVKGIYWTSVAHENVGSDEHVRPGIIWHVEVWIPTADTTIDKLDYVFSSSFPGTVEMDVSE